MGKGDICHIEAPCPGDCNYRGLCVKGKCHCRSGYGGEACEVEQCPANCSGHGTCVRTKKRSSGASMQCVCETGFSGFDCSMPDCPNDCSNNGVCHNGSCFCNHQWKGNDCSIFQDPCPNNCSNNGECDRNLGKCICHEDYYGTYCDKWKFAADGPFPDPCRNNCSGNGVCEYEEGSNGTVAKGCI